MASLSNSIHQIGCSEVNRAGIAPDADGQPMLCYAGDRKNLELLTGLPDVRYWSEWNCLAFPVKQENLLMLETVGQIQEATDDYVGMRHELLRVPMELASLYPAAAPGQPQPFKHQIDAFCLALDAYRKGMHGFASYACMGTGKTRWAIDVLRFIADNSISVIIVQNSTALQWHQNLARNWPDAEVTLLTGVPIPERIERIKKLDREVGPHALVVNWESLARLAYPLCKLKPKIVVADEASRAKDRNSQMAKAAFKLADASEFAIAMTGTPIGNNPSDLWSLYRFMDPAIFGKSYWAFAKKYFRLGGFTGNEFTGFDSTNISEFINKVYSCAYRITKACIGDMPEKLYETVQIPMSSEQQKLHDQIEKDLYATLETEEGRKTLTVANVLSRTIRLQQVTAGLFPSDDGSEEPISIGSAKTEWLIEYLKESHSNSDAKFVVWAKFRRELEIICDRLQQEELNHAFIDGTVKTEDRENIRERFNDSSDPLRILVCNLQAGAYGMDLPRADTLIYHSNTWSHIERSQSEDRGHRLGRIRSYQIIDLVCKKSVDIDIAAALRKKQNIAHLLLMKGVSGGD